jgi:hypothetical protein
MLRIGMGQARGALMRAQSPDYKMTKDQAPSSKQITNLKFEIQSEDCHFECTREESIDNRPVAQLGGFLAEYRSE